MYYRELGDSGVEVSEVGFGAWVVGTDWWGDRDRSDAVNMVQHALDRGVTYFDTGDVYGHGDSEEIVGEALREHREAVTVGTKIGYDFYDNPQAGHGELPKELTPEYLREAFERSLDRLGMDRVELLQLHNADVDEVTPEVVDVLREFKTEGKVDALGWALGPSIGWLAEGEAAVDYEVFDAVQTVFNVFEQDPGMHFIDEIRERDADTAVLARVPHSSGLLNEQVTPDTELGEGDHRSHRPSEWYETGWEKVESLRFLERSDEQSSSGSRTQSGNDSTRKLSQASIQWLLYHDEVASVTPTFRDTDDIDEWAAAPETPPLSGEEYDRVQELYADDFGIEEFDGMDALRTSVGGEDIEAAGLDREPATY